MNKEIKIPRYVTQQVFHTIVHIGLKLFLRTRISSKKDYFCFPQIVLYKE